MPSIYNSARTKRLDYDVEQCLTTWRITTIAQNEDQESESFVDCSRFHTLDKLQLDLKNKRLTLKRGSLSPAALVFLLRKGASVDIPKPSFDLSNSEERLAYAHYCGLRFLITIANGLKTKYHNEISIMLGNLSYHNYELTLIELLCHPTPESFFSAMQCASLKQGSSGTDFFELVIKYMSLLPEYGQVFLVDLKKVFSAMNEDQLGMLALDEQVPDRVDETAGLPTGQRRYKPSFLSLLCDLMIPRSKSFKKLANELEALENIDIGFKDFDLVELFGSYRSLYFRNYRANQRKAALKELAANMLKRFSGDVDEFATHLLSQLGDNPSLRSKINLNDLLNALSDKNFKQLLWTRNGQAILSNRQFGEEQLVKRLFDLYKPIDSDESDDESDDDSENENDYQELTKLFEWCKDTKNCGDHVFLHHQFFIPYLAVVNFVHQDVKVRETKLLNELEWFIGSATFTPQDVNSIVETIQTFHSQRDYVPPQRPCKPFLSTSSKMWLINYFLENVLSIHPGLVDEYSPETLCDVYKQRLGKNDHRRNSASSIEAYVGAVLHSKWNSASFKLMVDDKFAGVITLSEFLPAIETTTLEAWLLDASVQAEIIDAIGVAYGYQVASRTEGYGTIENSALNVLSRFFNTLCLNHPALISLLQDEMVAHTPFGQALFLLSLYPAYEWEGEAHPFAIADEKILKSLLHYSLENHHISFGQLIQLQSQEINELLASINTSWPEFIRPVILSDTVGRKTNIENQIGLTDEEKTAIVPMQYADNLLIVWQLLGDFPGFLTAINGIALISKCINPHDPLPPIFLNKKFWEEVVNFGDPLFDESWVKVKDFITNVISLRCFFPKFLQALGREANALQLILKLNTPAFTAWFQYAYLQPTSQNQRPILDFLFGLGSWSTVDKESRILMFNALGGFNTFDTWINAKSNGLSYAYSRYNSNVEEHVALFSLASRLDESQQLDMFANASKDFCQALYKYFFNDTVATNSNEQFAPLRGKRFEFFISLKPSVQQLLLRKFFEAVYSKNEVEEIMQNVVEQYGGFYRSVYNLHEILAPIISVYRLANLLSIEMIHAELSDFAPEYLSLVKLAVKKSLTSENNFAFHGVMYTRDYARGDVALRFVKDLMLTVSKLEDIFYYFAFLYDTKSDEHANGLIIAKALREMLATGQGESHNQRQLIKRWELSVGGFEQLFSDAWSTFFTESGMDQQRTMTQVFSGKPSNGEKLKDAVRLAVHNVFIAPLEAEEEDLEEKQQRLEETVRQIKAREQQVEKEAQQRREQQRAAQEKQQLARKEQQAQTEAKRQAVEAKAVNALVTQLVANAAGMSSNKEVLQATVGQPDDQGIGAEDSNECVQQTEGQQLQEEISTESNYPVSDIETESTVQHVKEMDAAQNRPGLIDSHKGETVLPEPTNITQAQAETVTNDSKQASNPTKLGKLARLFVRLYQFCITSLKKALAKLGAIVPFGKKKNTKQETREQQTTLTTVETATSNEHEQVSPVYPSPLASERIGNTALLGKSAVSNTVMELSQN